MNTVIPSSVVALLLAGFSAHGASIVVSGWLTNVSGDDSPYEYAQFVATQDIDFAASPHTIVWNDVGTVETNLIPQGWAAGSTISFAFQLTSGTISRGEVFYIGGSGQVIAGPGSTSLAGERWLRVINTSVNGGDGLGIPEANGVFGNGGPNADGIAVFAGLSGSITPTTVPSESVFFGFTVGTAHPATGGFKAADNDHYSSAGVFGDAGNSFLFGDLAQGQFMRLTGTYNWFTGQWEIARTGEVISLTAFSPVSAIASRITLIPEPGIGLSTLAGLAFLAARRFRRG